MALGQLRGERLRRARPVAQLDLALEPEARGVLGEARAAAARRSRRGRPSARRRGAPAPRPRPAARRARRGRRGSRPAARCAARAPPHTRGASRRGRATARPRPGRGARGAAPARRARARGGRAGRRTRAAGRPRPTSFSTAAPSARSRFGSPGLKPTRHLVAPERVLAHELEPRQLGAEAHDLALVRRPARAPGAGEVERLEQVRLAGAVAARDDREPRPQPHVRRLVGAEVAQAEVRRNHTLSRIGIRRYWKPESSAASIRPGRSGEISLQQQVAAPRRPPGRRAGTPG